MSNQHVHPIFRDILAGLEPTPVADFRIDTVRVKECDFYRLPDSVQTMFRVYAEGGLAKVEGNDLVFRFPIYRTQEIAAAIAKYLP